MNRFIVATKLPHRLQEYLYRYCYDHKGNGLGIVLDVRALMPSAVRQRNTILVKSINRGEILEQVYHGGEISLLEPVSTPVDTIDIVSELDELYQLMKEARQDAIEFGWYEYEALAGEHANLWRKVPALLKANGHTDQGDADRVFVMHLLVSKIANASVCPVN